MKNLLKVTVAIVLATSLFSCKSTKPEDMHNVFILVDNTDKVDYNEILSTDKLVNMVPTGGSVTFKALTGVDINVASTVTLDIPQDATSTQRADAVEPFQASVDSLKTAYLKAGEGYQKSSLYVPICEAIKSLTKDGGRKTLIVISDMIENSEYGNFYTDAGVKKGVEAEASLESKSNVNVIILFDPHQSNKKEDQFKRAMQFWKKAFADAGIKYAVKAKL